MPLPDPKNSLKKTKSNPRVKLLIGVAVCFAALWANNSSLLTQPIASKPLLLAHRGVHQDFSHKGLTMDACTANRIFPPQNKFIEDTIPSMREAFKDGADIVELDIHPTTDGQFAVFHDWTLDCRTDGHGVTRKQSLAYLKTLDIGYGYTADGGKTFPLRGQGIALMPSLDEVLETFPENSFLIHIKSGDPQEGKLLAAKLRLLPAKRQHELAVYGGARPVAVVHTELPSVRTMSVKTEKTCLIRYVALGWSGYIPETCRNSVLPVPVNVARWLWGWPNKFLRRMADNGTLVFAADDYADTGRGLNSAEDLAKLPANYSGGIWTDRIEIIGPLTARH